jgi:dipeptidyl aminopeptidase/acylaminoacyl peptidase
MDPHSEELSLVEAGYAVFTPDCPTMPDSFVTDIVADISSGINQVVKFGLADPNRVGILGQSDGVEVALNYLIANAEVKAAVLEDGFAIS